MKQADLAELRTRGFARKWWEDKRSSKAKGSGVGKALDAWVAAGLPPAKALNQTFGTGKQDNRADKFEAAFAALALLEAALKVARTKAASATDTIDGIKIYEAELKKHKKDLQDLYDQAVQDCLNAKQNFSQKTGERLAEYKVDLQAIDKTVILAASAEKAAAAALAKGDAGEIERYTGQVQGLIAQAQQAHDRMNKRFDANKAWDLAQKGPGESPKNYGVLPRDLGPIKTQMEQATNNIFETSTIKDNARSRLEELEDHRAAIEDLAKQGQRSLGQWTVLADDIQREAAALTNENSQGSGQLIKNGKEKLKRLQGFLNSKQPLPKEDHDVIRGLLEGIHTDLVRMPRFAAPMARVAKKRDRIPAAIKTDPAVKQLLDKLEDYVQLFQEHVKVARQIEDLTAKVAETIQRRFPEPVA